MRILQIHNRYRKPGGEDGVGWLEAKLLRQHGHEVLQFKADNQTLGFFGGIRAAATGVWNLRAYERLPSCCETAPSTSCMSITCSR